MDYDLDVAEDNLSELINSEVEVYRAKVAS